MANQRYLDVLIDTMMYFSRRTFLSSANSGFSCRLNMGLRDKSDWLSSVWRIDDSRNPGLASEAPKQAKYSRQQRCMSE